MADQLGSGIAGRPQRSNDRRLFFDGIQGRHREDKCQDRRDDVHKPNDHLLIAAQVVSREMDGLIICFLQEILHFVVAEKSFFHQL